MRSASDSDCANCSSCVSRPSSAEFPPSRRRSSSMSRTRACSALCSSQCALGQRFEFARWLYVSCFSGRLCEEAASPLCKIPQLARIAREKMQAAHLTLWLRPDTYASEGKRRVGETSGRVRPADLRVLLPVSQSGEGHVNSSATVGTEPAGI